MLNILLALVHGEPNPSTFKFFFPVYEYTEKFDLPYDAPLSTFKGLTLKNGVRLKGFYHVRNREDFPLLMNVWLPSDPRFFQWRQGIPLFGHSV